MSENIHCSANAMNKESFKKLFLLYVVSRFKKGVYGKKRLHKIVYIAERELDIRPFEFKKYHFGQYSDSMDEVLEQLLSMGYLVATPLETKSADHFGNKFELADTDLGGYYSLFIEKIHPRLAKIVDKILNDYGYLPESELLEKVYQFPEFARARGEDIIFDEQLPDCLEVKDLGDEDIEELEISLNPKFINLLKRMDKAFEQGDFDPQKVKRVVELM